MLSRNQIIAILAASAAVAAIAISQQSYWIDEALSIIIAMTTTPAEALKYATAVSGSTLQMPFYHTYLFGWHKVFGQGEWALRASNLPWLLFGQLGFLIILRHRPRLALLSASLALVSPMIWGYLDEVRPYLMQYASSCWLVAALAYLSMEQDSGSSTRSERASQTLPLGALAVAAIILFFTSPLGAIWAVALLTGLFVIPRSNNSAFDSKISIKFILLAATVAFFYLIIGLYYLWTMTLGGAGYHLAGATPLSLPYIAYDLLGFTGFGPGKLEMRTAPLASLIRSSPNLLPLALCYVVLSVVFWRRWRSRSERLNRMVVVAWAIAIVLPSLVIFFGLSAANHRTLPRHFIPLLPAIILGLSGILISAARGRNLMAKLLAFGLPILWLLSSLLLRVHPVHAKDDYRQASEVARSALENSDDVWWVADASAAFVYGVPINLEKVYGSAWGLQSPEFATIRFELPPDILVLSKPDIYDSNGSIKRFLDENNFTEVEKLQGFTIYTR